MSDLDLLRNLSDQISPPPLGALRATAAARARRTATGLAAAAAAVVAVLTITFLFVLDHDTSKPEPAPVPRDTSHPLTYALGTTIHYGDQTDETPAEVVELDVTDDGVVARLKDGRIWFTDGTSGSELGDVGEPSRVYLRNDHPYGSTGGLVVSGNTGSRAAWFEFASPDSPELVVYDTGSGKEVARQPIEPQGSWALLHSVTEHYAYLFFDPDIEDEEPTWRVDLATGELKRIVPDVFYQDRPPLGTPRTLEVSHAQGDEPVVFRSNDAVMWQFDINGKGRVEPQGPQPLDARDGGSGKRFEFDAPADYAGTAPNWLVQWLDDESLVIVVNRNDTDSLLECRFASGTCTLADEVPQKAVLPEIDG